MVYVNFKDFKDILLEYTFKDINAIFGNFFDESLPRVSKKYNNFNDLYNTFEINLKKFRDEYEIGEEEMKIPTHFIVNTYSKLKKYLSEKTKDTKKRPSNEDSVLDKFLNFFPKILFLVVYFKKYTQRYDSLLKKDLPYIPVIKELVNNYEKLTLEEITKIVSENSLFTDNYTLNIFVIDNMISTFARSKIKPVYEDNRVVVYKPKNWVESRILGADTGWCISSSTAKQHFPFHEKLYYIYFVFLKPVKAETKYALLIYKKPKQFMDFVQNDLDNYLKAIKVSFIFDAFVNKVNSLRRFMEFIFSLYYVTDRVGRFKRRGEYISKKHAKVCVDNIYFPETFLQKILLFFYRVPVLFLKESDNFSINYKLAHLVYKLVILQRKKDILNFINGEYMNPDFHLDPDKIKRKAFDEYVNEFSSVVYGTEEEGETWLILKNHLDENFPIKKLQKKIDILSILKGIANDEKERNVIDILTHSLTKVDWEWFSEQYDKIKFTSFSQILRVLNSTKYDYNPFSTEFDLKENEREIEIIGLFDKMTPNEVVIKTIADVVDENNLLSLVKTIVKSLSSEISLIKLKNVRKSNVVASNPFLSKVYDTIISTLSTKNG